MSIKSLKLQVSTSKIILYGIHFNWKIKCCTAFSPSLLFSVSCVCVCVCAAISAGSGAGEGEVKLPAFLASDGGINSGFMIAHCTSAALGELTHQVHISSLAKARKPGFSS